MKSASTLLLSLLLTASLMLYGAVGMAKAGGSAVFSMEICADGVAKTVSFDADGNPIDPAQNCPECLICCQAINALAVKICPALPSFALLGIEVERFVAQNPIINKRNIHPAPRGPPAVQFSIPKLSPFDQFLVGNIARSDGRPMPKDASV